MLFRSGLNRPINNVALRQKVLLSIKYIDRVFVFDSENSLETLIKSLNIDTIVVGDDYKYKNVIGSKYVSHLEFFSKKYDISTTKILNYE